MQYGKKPTGGMWRMSIQLRHAPLCPGCAAELQGVVVEIRHGWAWCPICAATRLHRDRVIRHILATDAFRKHSTRQHGLLFYTPQSSKRPARTAFGFMDDKDVNPDRLSTTRERFGLDLQTPAGVHENDSFALTKLGEVELTMRAVRNRDQART